MRDRFELKACPFCGYEADCISEDAGWDSCGENLWRVDISCMSCGANIEIERRCDRLLRDDDVEGETCHALEELAIDMWNARSVERENGNSNQEGGGRTTFVRCCDNCANSHDYGSRSREHIECRRFPPVLVDSEDDRQGWAFPCVLRQHWCGEWKEICDARMGR